MTKTKVQILPVKNDRRSIRLRDYDYTSQGAYFITVCTKNKIPYFSMNTVLNEIVQKEWELLTERFPDMTDDAFIVMPNHVHGIIILTRNDKNVGATLEVARRAGSSPAPTIGRIIGAYKSICIRKWAAHLAQVHGELKDSFWQRNYYDHIIRNETELNAIREYIYYNPVGWSFDSENPDHILDKYYQRKWSWLERTVAL